DDRRRALLRFLEEVADTRRADPDDRLDELGRGEREERHVGLTRNGARKERLARPGRPGKQHSMRDAAAEDAVLLRMSEEVDDLRQLVFRLVDAGDVGERHLVARGLVAPRAGAAERAENVLGAAGTAHQPEEQEDEEDRRAEAEQEVLPPRRRGVERLRIHDYPL